MYDCPICHEPLGNKAVICNGCGWEPVKKSKQADPLHGTCEYLERGQRCTAAAPYSSSTTGSGPWYCARHFPPFKGWNLGRDRTPPPQGFESLRPRSALQPLDYEAELERAAIQQEMK